jgi:hypothetical protein
MSEGGELVRAEWMRLDLVSRAVYFLGLSDLLLPGLSSASYFSQVEQALTACWEWVEHRVGIGDDLYTYAAGEDGIQFTQYEEEDIRRADSLGCVYQAVMQTAYGAYVLAGERYLPQDFECAEPEEVFDWFTNHFAKLQPDHARLMQHLLDCLCATDSNQISRTAVSRALSEEGPETS